MLTNIGLGLISLAWLIQLIFILKGKLAVNSIFVGVYIAGVAFLVVDGFGSGLTSLAWANLVSLVLAGSVFFALMKKPIEQQ